MPTYEYVCTACNHRFERVQKFTDDPVSECPECTSAVRKVFFAAGVVFKGSGWYINDSRPSSSSDSASSASSGSTPAAATTAATASDATPAAAATSPSEAKAATPAATSAAASA